MVTDPLMKLSRLRVSSMVPATFNFEVLLTIHSRAIKETAKKISGGLFARGNGIEIQYLRCRGQYPWRRAHSCP